MSQSMKSLEARLEGRKRVRYDTSVRLRLAGMQRDVDRLTVHNLMLRDALREAKDTAALQSDCFSSAKGSRASTPATMHPLPPVLPSSRPSPILTSVSEMRKTVASLEEALAANHRDHQATALELKRTREEKEALKQRIQTSKLGDGLLYDGMTCGSCDDRVRALQMEVNASREAIEALKSDTEVKIKYLTDTGVRWKSERDEAVEEKQVLNQQIEALFFCINKKDETIFVMCNNFFKMKLAKESTEEELLRIMVLHNKILDKVLDQLNDVNEDNSYLIHNLNQLARGGESDFDRRLTEVMRQKVGHELDKYRLLKEKNRLTLEVACLSTENDRLQWELEEVKRAVLPKENHIHHSSSFCNGAMSSINKLEKNNGARKAVPSTSSGSGSDRSDTHLLRNRSTSGCSSVDGDNNSTTSCWEFRVNEAKDMDKSFQPNAKVLPTSTTAMNVTGSSPRRHSVPGIGLSSHPSVTHMKLAPLGVRSEAGPFNLDPRSDSITCQTLKRAFGISNDAPRYLSSMSALSTFAGPQGDISTSLANLANVTTCSRDQSTTRCRAGDHPCDAAVLPSSDKTENPKSHFWSWWRHLSTAR